MSNTGVELDNKAKVEAAIRAEADMLKEQAKLEREKAAKKEVQEPIQQKVKDAKDTNNPAPIVDLIKTSNEDAERIKDAIDSRIDDKNVKAKASVKVDDPFRGEPNEKGTLRYSSTVTETVVHEVISAYKEKPALISVPPDTPSRNVLDELLNSIADPSTINEHTAPYIHTILKAATESTINNPLQDALSKQDLDYLYIIDRTLYRKVVASIVTAAEKSKIPNEEIVEFKAADELRRNPPDKEKRKIEKHTPEEANKLSEHEKRMSAIFTALKDAPAELAAVRALLRTYTSTFLEDPKTYIAYKEFATKPLPRVVDIDKQNKTYRIENPDYGLGLTAAEFDEYAKLYRKVLPTIVTDEETQQTLDAYDIRKEDFKALSGLQIDSQLRLVDDASIPVTAKYFERRNGAIVLTDYGKREMAQAVYVSVNKLLGKITSTMNVEWRSLYDPWYEGKIQRVIENTLFRSYQSKEIADTIRRLVAEKTNSTYLADSSVTEFVEYVRGLRAQYQNEISTRQNYFDLRNHIMKGTANPEQMAGFSKNFPAHTKEALFKGESGFLFQLALSEFQADLQARMAMNDNTLPADIFGSYFNENGEMNTPDLKRVRDRLWQKIERLKILVRTGDPQITRLMDSDPLIRKRYESILNTQLWEIERALILAPGFSLVDSMRSLEIVAQSARRKDFKGLFNFAQYITIIGKWRVSRGMQENKGGGFEIGELFNIAIRTNKEHKPLMERIMEKGWVPRDVYESAEPGKRKNIDKLVEEFDRELQMLQEQEGESFEKKFDDAFRDFALLGFYSRTGWRIEGFNKWYGREEDKLKKAVDGTDLSEGDKDKKKKEIGSVQHKYQYIREQVGAAACWFYDASRASDEVKHYLLTQMYGANYKERYTANQLKELFESYVEGHEKEKKVVKAYNAHGHVEAMTVEEFIEDKRLAYKGMNFKAVMERSPYDFMVIMNQLEPKLNTLVTVGSKKYSCYQYYFTDNVAKTQAEQVEKLRFLKSLDTKWGAENREHIARVAKIWHDTFMSGLFYNDGVDPLSVAAGDELDNVNTRKAEAAMYDVMTFALTQVKVKHKARMTGEDFMVDATDNSPDNQKFAEHSRFFRDQFVGDDGLLNYFDKLKERFGDKKGEELFLGTHGYFTQWSKVWEMQMGKNMFATTNELLEGYIFDNITEAGPDIFVRLWGDLTGWNKAVDSLITLDKKLLDAGESHKLDKIYEVHKEMQTLEGMISKRGAQKHNRQIAFLVARYFQTDWHTRIPGANLLGTLVKGKDTALSTLHGEMTSMTMNNGAIHDYLHHLVSEGFIDEEDMEIILENVGADLKKFMTVTGSPTIVLIGATFIVGAIFIKVLKDFLGSKK